MTKKLVQIHHQFKDGGIRFIRQQECSSLSEVAVIIKEAALSHPPPKDAQWLVALEGATEFVYAVDFESEEGETE